MHKFQGLGPGHLVASTDGGAHYSTQYRPKSVKAGIKRRLGVTAKTKFSQEDLRVPLEVVLGNTRTLLVGIQISAATMKKSMKFPLKTKNRTTI